MSTIKEFNIYNDERGCVRIKYIGGGQMPESLTGTYTSIREAEKDTERYLSTRPLKKAEKEDAKS
jgi:hypothetical protein